jgi:hypothetical protein
VKKQLFSNDNEARRAQRKKDEEVHKNAGHRLGDDGDRRLREFMITVETASVLQKLNSIPEG